ncbi:mpv17-like protein 2 [Gigantopelta aegis]|uniref:mpv17-like protein 2 n=1 Tax=Gigantopelta aegis TaxID=1735272 RepID=UPI001B8880DF|nr:mpv17-like protein 2 [Gigantopelta aegis]
MLAAVKLVTKRLFTKHLLATNIATSGVFLAIGDIVCQKIEKIYKSDHKKHDWRRTGRMFAVGLVLGPANHYWYSMLDRFLSGTARRTIMKKIAADQLVAAPFMGTTFLFAMGLLEGSSFEKSAAEWKEKFPLIYLFDWVLWPPAQFINFTYLPTKYRVLYVSFITLLWDIMLSFIKHREPTHEVTEVHVSEVR